jgi:hypothetical protein
MKDKQYPNVLYGFKGSGNAEMPVKPDAEYAAAVGIIACPDAPVMPLDYLFCKG